MATLPALTAKHLRQMRRNPGLLYRTIRNMRGLTQADMAALMGLSRDSITQRERSKVMFCLEELIVLQRISQLDDESWWMLCKEIAKE